MRRFCTVLALSLLAQPALAEGLSPIQMYLQGEVGYAPPRFNPRPAYVPPAPYTVAQSQPEVTPQPAADATHINTGVVGMNN